MADRAEQSNRRTAFSGRGWLTSCSRLARSRAAQTAGSALLRTMVLLTIIWVLAVPVNQTSTVAGAAALPPSASGPSTTYQDSGFAVAEGSIGSYFAARGGVRTFGPPVSNEFPLLGSRMQIFRDFVLKVDPSGNVSTVNLFEMGAVPFRNVGGRIIPEVDQALVQSAPVPGTPDYGARVQEFIRANAPDQFDGLPVGFYKAFVNTVQYEDAFPNGGERSLLAGFDREIWGVPVSRPVHDAQNPDVVLLRWERGVMVWTRETGAVSAIPLGETFKAILTGQGLGPERTAAASGSQFLLQLDPTAPDGVARPGELPDTILASAFQPSAAAVAAAQLSNAQNAQTGSNVQQYQTPTYTPVSCPYCVTPTPTVQSWYGTPTPTPYYQSGNPTNGYNQTNQPNTQYPNNQYPNNQYPNTGQQQGTAPLPGAINQPNTGQPGQQAGTDPCYGDEQITFAPETPRVNNEVLIAVTSSRPHPYGRLAGTEKTNFVRERQGQLGLVWEWTVQLSYPGQHEYTFYVDSTIPCKKIQLTVRESLATKTPRPTKTATPYGWNNNNGNGNSNNNDNNNNNGSVPYRDPSQFYLNTSNNYDCRDFYSQGETQRVLRYGVNNGFGDKNGLDSEDGATDGIACTTYRNWQYNNDSDYNPVSYNNGTATPTPSFWITPTNTVGPGTPTLVPTVAGTFNPLNYINRGDAFNCIDFTSQADAQAVLRADPNDPNKLDISGLEQPALPHAPDGIACNSGTDAPEWGQSFFYPQPYDKTPVPTPNGGRRTGTTNNPSTPAATDTPVPVRTRAPANPTSITNQ